VVQKKLGALWEKEIASVEGFMEKKGGGIRETYKRVIAAPWVHSRMGWTLKTNREGKENPERRGGGGGEGDRIWLRARGGGGKRPRRTGEVKEKTKSRR